VADREPLGGSSRPTGEMPVTSDRPTTPHATHDLVLLAAAADRDADPGLRSAADSQIAGCDECASIAADLNVIVAGLAGLPATRTAPRDMRISGEQAARLRRGRLWRALLRPFGAAGLPGLRPLAATLTTLGLAGLLLTAIPLGLPGSGSAALAPTTGKDLGLSEASQPSSAPVPLGPGYTVSTPRAMSTASDAAAGPPSTAQPSSGDQFGGIADRATNQASGRTAFGPAREATRDLAGPLSGVPPLAVVSLGLLAVGLALISLRVLARRVD
jgi:hypothetical protein